MDRLKQNFKNRQLFFRRFWWVGLSVVVLVSVVTLVNILSNKKIDTAQVESAQIGPVKGGEDEMPVLKNLVVDFGTYNPNTKKAGAFVFEPSESMIFLNIGAKVKGPDGWKIIPEFEYRTNPNAKVHAAADGVVTRVEFQKDSKDYEIEAKPNVKSFYSVIYDHVKGVTIKVGDKIKVGQVLGTAGTWGNGLGRTELMVNKTIGGGVTEHYCPFKFFDPSLLKENEKKVSVLMKDWENFKGNTALYNQAKDIWPGCLYEKLIEDSTGVHQ